MKVQKIGYIRVSSEDQNISRQLKDIDLDKKFVDYESAKDTKRKSLIDMLEYAREGDTVIVHSMDRLARNTRDILDLVKQFNEKQVKVEFAKENLTFTGEDDAMSQLLLCVMSGVADFERSVIRERQKEGIAIAKASGKYRGRHKKLSSEQILLLQEMIANGNSKKEIMAELSVSRKTIYNYRKQGETK